MTEEREGDEGTEGHARRQPYWWFHGDSVVELFSRLASVGPHNARLEVHRRGEQVVLIVKGGVSALDDDPPDPPINESHLCPPQC